MSETNFDESSPALTDVAIAAPQVASKKRKRAPAQAPSPVPSLPGENTSETTEEYASHRASFYRLTILFLTAMVTLSPRGTTSSLASAVKYLVCRRLFPSRAHPHFITQTSCP